MSRVCECSFTRFNVVLPLSLSLSLSLLLPDYSHAVHSSAWLFNMIHVQLASTTKIKVLPRSLSSLSLSSSCALWFTTLGVCFSFQPDHLSLEHNQLTVQLGGQLNWQRVRLRVRERERREVYLCATCLSFYSSQQEEREREWIIRLASNKADDTRLLVCVYVREKWKRWTVSMSQYKHRRSE